MKIGTKSVLYGAHCFFLHPWFVALAWWKIYGFPFDPRLWVAFIVHDLGYIGKPNMDGPEGEKHPALGAVIMWWMFDWWGSEQKWFDFVLFHSRYLSKLLDQPFSRLCVADKLAWVLTPRWLYLLSVRLTGEYREYMAISKRTDINDWYDNGISYTKKWVEEHKTGKQDTWTKADRSDNAAQV